MGVVKVPRHQMESWHRTLSGIARRQPEEVPFRVLEVIRVIDRFIKNSDAALLDVPACRLRSWNEILTLYVRMVSEDLLIPPAFCESINDIAKQFAQWAVPHVRYITSQNIFRMQEVREHYYGGLELTLSDEDAVEVDLSPLHSCKELKRLWLSLGSVTALDLSPLKTCTGLETLYISLSDLKRIDLTPLSSCKNLRSLDIIASGLYELDLSPLRACTNLTSLNVSFADLKSLDLSPLSECVKIKYLSLDSNHLAALDLSPLNSCVLLSSVSLEYNEIKELDLSPLEQCRDLRFLDIGRNALSRIDLLPLAKNTNLRTLRMEDNRIKKIDLSPLSAFRSLTVLNLGNNQLKTIDLTPLSKVSELEEILLHRNRLTTLDSDSLTGCRQLKRLDLRNNNTETLDISGLLCTTSESLEILVEPNVRVEADSVLRQAAPKLEWGENTAVSFEWRPIRAVFKESGWEGVSGRVKKYLRCLKGPRRFAAKRAFLEDMGVAELAGVDKDITPLMESIESEVSFRRAKNQLHEGVVRLLQEQLDEGGSSFFLDVDKLRKTKGEVLIPKIQRRRKEELENTIVPEKKGSVHLEPLWLTVHGFEVLKGLKMPLKKTTVERFERVKEALRDRGLKFKTKRFKKKRLSKQYAVAMSRELKQYVLKLASSKGSR
ncbi:MAG: leucine-rich repeat domain-containing protein [Candidatus Thorarchaeota archaeon]